MNRPGPVPGVVRDRRGHLRGLAHHAVGERDAGGVQHQAGEADEESERVGVVPEGVRRALETLAARWATLDPGTRCALEIAMMLSLPLDFQTYSSWFFSIESACR